MLVSPISFIITCMLIRRIGLFFLIVGVLMVFLFFAIGEPNSQNLKFFCTGLPLAILGGAIWLRKRERTPVERFRILRRFSTQKEEEYKDE